MTDPTPAVTAAMFDFQVLEYNPDAVAAAFGLEPGRPRIGDTVELSTTGDPLENRGLMSWTCPRCGELIEALGDLADLDGTLGFTLTREAEVALSLHYATHSPPKETRP